MICQTYKKNSQCDNKNEFIDFIFGISILSLIFLDSNLVGALGMANSRTTLAYTPFVLFALVQTFRYGIGIWFKYKIINSIFLLGLLCLVLNFSVERNVFKTVLLYFWLPFLLASYLTQCTPKQNQILQKIVLLFLFVEIGLAIYERVTLSVVFATEDIYSMMNRNGDTWSFRASALYGHPLANAMAIMIITLFMITSKSIPSKYRIFFFFFTLAGLLCFNERGNILVFVSASLPILSKIFKEAKGKEKVLLCIILTIMIIVGVYLLTTTDLGGRLFHSENNFSKHDGSAKARMEAFDVFNRLNYQELLWGGDNLYDRMLILLNLVGIENGYISIILRYGLIIGIPTILLYMYFQWSRLMVYPFIQRTILFASFHVIAFSNPHITSPAPWVIFIVSYYAFRPKQIIIKK